MSADAVNPRRELLEAFAEGIDRIGEALADLGAAYELLDETSGEHLEAQLFRPVQAAYGRSQRAHNDFAERVGLPTRSFTAPGGGAPSRGVTGLVAAALDSIEQGDDTLVSLQDSMMLVELGDRELRSAVAEVRRHLDEAVKHAGPFLSTLGR
ncbi:unannotated protein [freshwater metagenome]|jgi:hypothetical protein|uniref:Unannotated protein n=1 Tax=freshwater metagenome TaxID=449393 RepID=A0A6J7JQ55_9ZZZZ|nr:hypothetical protein [Actinomycetota bacterium]